VTNKTSEYERRKQAVEKNDSERRLRKKQAARYYSVSTAAAGLGSQLLGKEKQHKS